MTTFTWELIAIFLTTGIGILIYIQRTSQNKSCDASEEDMMRIIANHALFQQYFNQGDEISDVEILETLYSPDRSCALIQALCKRHADGNKTIRLYFVSIAGNQYAPRLVTESTRSLDWGQRLAFYDELKPLKLAIYSDYLVEATYQQLALTSFDGIGINYKVEKRVVKFALPLKAQRQTNILIVPAHHLNN